MHVVLTADGNYAMPLAVVICSVAANCDFGRPLRFTVFYPEFPMELREKVDRSLARSAHPDATIEWRRIDLSSLADLPVPEKYMNPVIYARILIPHLLEGERFLYLDSDLTVIDDISVLLDTDFGGRTIVAVRDRFGTFGKRFDAGSSFGIPAQAPYFNSGVILIDANAWRKRNVSARVLEFMRENRSNGNLGDQDGLNVILHDDWAEADFRWNWQAVPDMRVARKARLFGLGNQEKSVIHFVTSLKPWLPGCNVHERAKFYEYVDETAWEGWRIPRMHELRVRTKSILRALLVRRH